VLDIWNHNQTNVLEAEILGRMEKYKNLLGKLDVVYSSTVKCVDGLLPAEAEVLQLAQVVSESEVPFDFCLSISAPFCFYFVFLFLFL
jgi:hypothetical protein